MVGSRHGWPGIMVGILFLTGCVGLGDIPPYTAVTKRPRPKPVEQSSSPELRIADFAVAQADRDIPIVPVPPPKPRSSENRAATVKERPQADGSTPTSMPHTARQLIQQAADRCATLDSYIVRLTRRESMKGKAGPEEIISFSFRKKPFSVHLKWLGKTAEGREVIYVKDRFDNKIHTKVAAGDSLLIPAGARLSLSPDNPLVRAASRHPITDAGICKCIDSLVALLDASERGDHRFGTLTVLAPQKRPEYPQPVETLQRLIPPGVEPELPRGGRRLMFFDPEWRLPMLVITYDDKGNEVEYYRYDRMMTPANLDDDDFNPDKLWQQKVRTPVKRP